MSDQTCKNCGTAAAEERTSCAVCGSAIPNQGDEARSKVAEERKFTVVAYLRVDADDPELMTLAEATKEMHTQGFIQPEHIFKVEELDEETVLTPLQGVHPRN